MIVVTNDGMRAQLTWLVTYLKGLRLGLYVNDPALTPATVLADILEATFIGYGGLPLSTWSSVYINGQGVAETDAPPVLYTVTAPSSAQSVYGYYVSDAYGYLIYAERNPGGPVPMWNVGDVFALIPRYMLYFIT